MWANAYNMYLILSDDPTPQFVVVSEELSGTDAILVHCIPNPLEYDIQVSYVRLLKTQTHTHTQQKIQSCSSFQLVH